MGSERRGGVVKEKGPREDVMMRKREMIVNEEKKLRI